MSPFVAFALILAVGILVFTAIAFVAWVGLHLTEKETKIDAADVEFPPVGESWGRITYVLLPRGEVIELENDEPENDNV